MKIKLKLLLGCATLGILCAEELQTTTDDVLAMLQSSLRVKENNNDTDQNDDFSLGAPDMSSINKLEELVMARVRDDKVLGDNKLTKTLNASIKTFYSSIIATTAANQKQIILNIKAFEKCKITMWRKYDKVIPVERDHWIMGLVYPKCIKAEEKLEMNKKKNDREYKTIESSYRTLKRLAKIEENKCVNVCNNKKFENYHEQLEALSKYYADCKEKIGPAVDKAKKEQKKVLDKVAAKKLSNAKYIAMRDKCKRIAYIMNSYKCKAITMLDGSCSFYEECWKRAQKKYDEDNVIIRKQEKEMKVQWRALHRIQCFLLVLNEKNDKNQKKEKSQLDKCIAIKRADISTKHLDIDYKKIPKKPKCPRDPMCPCTKFYTNSYYRTGPKERCVHNKVKNYLCPACSKKKKR